jgi:hypothetical protein
MTNVERFTPLGGFRRGGVKRFVAVDGLAPDKKRKSAHIMMYQIN